MKNIFYFTFITLFFFSNILAEELDEEFIDKKFDKIYTADFCSTNELNSDERKDFVLAFILGWHWELKESKKLNKLNQKKFEKIFNQICMNKELLINDLENLIVKNNFKLFLYTGHDWIKLENKRKKIFIKGYNAGIYSNNDEKKRKIVKYNVLFSRLSDYYFYTNLRDEFIGVSIKTIVDQIFGPQQ